MRAHRLQTAPVCTDLLAFGTGDDVIPLLQGFLRDEGIRAGRVGPGIGAFSSAVLAFFDPQEGKYHEFEIQGPVEVTNVSGNVATLDGEPRLHLHATLSRRDGSCVGGHLVSARVEPTLELFITRYDRALLREVDAETGLPLLDRG
ncbi:MAG: DNA-binding protein [Gemmatimonadales bacterium]|nr:MAG: DNA-binding protein [Gemmatimonadales bacterium]